MSIRNLNRLLHPATVAVIGASCRPHSVGETVLHNLIAGRFHGAIYPVNPKYASLAGLQAYARVADLPAVPDLAVICTPPATVPGLIAELGLAGTRAAIVLTAGLGAPAAGGGTLKDAMLANARPHLLRILGPNCVGLLAPSIGLNASFAHTAALPGNLAFVSQSGALVTAVLDRARSRGTGFSLIASLGDSADADVGDLLDYLAADSATHAILLYVEEIRQARKFMSAARAAARCKPVLIVKAARSAQAAQAAASHTGALAGADDVYDAAIRRAGMLRVASTDALFSAVEVLAGSKRPASDKLLIVTNGGGPGILAVDALIEAGGRLAALPADLVAELDLMLPSNWSRANPVDLIGDAPVERYVGALTRLLDTVGDASILFIHAPTAIVPSEEIASALLPLFAASQRCVLSCWLGADAVAQARHQFTGAGLPCFETPEDAIAGFMQLVQFHRNQTALMQAPPAADSDFAPDRAAVAAIIAAAGREARAMLTEPEAKDVLAAYGIPVVETLRADDIDAVEVCARRIGFPVAVKLLSPDVSHKSDVGGVALDLPGPAEARAAALAMHDRLAQLRPGARLLGYTVQAMARRPGAHELIAGIAADRVFGPVILFGQGGIAVETIADRALGLPPLNALLAGDMIAGTRIARLLSGYRNRPAADLGAVARVLIRLSQLALDFPAIAELDINPLLADERGVMALDARIRIAAASTVAQPAIRPYPQELERTLEWNGTPLLIRPIRPDDTAAYLRFFDALQPEDVRSRMLVSMRQLSPLQLARFTQIDYDREMAFVAIADGAILGIARAIADPDNEDAEFAVTVRSDLKHKGLGVLLMGELIDYCRARGTGRLTGVCLGYNSPMLALAGKFGMQVEASGDPSIMQLGLPLGPAPAPMDVPF